MSYKVEDSGGLTNNELLILEYIRLNSAQSSKEIHEGIDADISYATVKRILTKLSTALLVIAVGKGRGSKYEIGVAYELHCPIDMEKYFADDIDDRKVKSSYDFNLMPHVLNTVDLFTIAEIAELQRLQDKYLDNTSKLTIVEYKKELERLSIDLSWKSSQIEGNTYSLLETERLLQEKEMAVGKTQEEATMLLNHKKALDFIIDEPTYIHPLKVSGIEDIHSILMAELGIERNIRTRRVGITGTNYRPLDNEFQIREALSQMCDLVNQKENVFEKALLVLVLISYIQPFADGNKRTARIVSNAVLMHHQICPLSFRTIDSITYKKAMLVFYEQNNIIAFKRIFMDQFQFAVETYF